jgi:hypothetical protein
MQPSTLEALALKQVIATAVSGMEQALATAWNKPTFDWRVLPRMFHKTIEEALFDQLKMDVLLNATQRSPTVVVYKKENDKIIYAVLV